MSAADPASLCGTGIQDLSLPRRVPSTHLVYQGSRLIMISRRSGHEVEFPGETTAEDHVISRALALFPALLNREVQPLKIIRVEKVDGEPPERSTHHHLFLASGFRQEAGRLVLRPSVR
jgi:ATP-dependent Lhr-like helicase